MPGSTVDGLTIAERAVAAAAFDVSQKASESKTINPELPLDPGPLVDQGTVILPGLRVSPTGETEGVQKSRFHKGFDVLVRVNVQSAISTDEGETSQSLLDGSTDLSAFTDAGLRINGVDLEIATGTDMVGNGDFLETYGDDLNEPNVSAQLPLNMDGTYSDDNVFGLPGAVLDDIAANGTDGVPGGGALGDIVVATGYWVLLENVPRGQHELVATGAFADGGSFETTHKIMVTPLPAAAWFMLSGIGFLAGARRFRRRG